MTTFQTVNVGPGRTEYPPEATIPTTPTTPRGPLPTPARPAPAPPVDDMSPSMPNTPTTLNFGGVNGQRPLPSSPFSNSLSSPHRSINEVRPELVARGDSHRSIRSTGSQDVDMDDSDGEDVGSDTESVDADGRPSKKKKGQRFFCTEFPPCKLSFTRSEHLARHIRKHTGERPFQCHCSRRFSRLDNLRQHAQTVHINEEIPQDSLAATGTRFQRQIRTDRVARPTGGRSRASTAGSQGGHVRGHSRNLSASSIGSTASTVSRDDGRRRPPPLMMANEHTGRARLSLDVLRSGASTPPGQGSFYRESSEGINTPTSTTFSTGQNSPGYGSSLGSPVSAVSRGGFWDGRSHARRLSVPSGPVPFQSPQHISYGSPYLLSPLASSTASTFSNFSSSLGSPINATHPLLKASAASSAAEAEWRRRTWHPSTYTQTNYSRPATSGLSYYQTPDAPRPAFAPQAAAAASQPQRLPGIESFDPVPRRPATPPARGPSPMKIDTAVRPPVYPGPTAYASSGPNDRRGLASWDMSLHQNLTKLDLASGTPPRDQVLWNQNASSNPRPSGEQASRTLHGPPVVIHQESQKRTADNPHYPTPHSNRAKRQGWYAGPPPGGQQSTSQPRTSPEGSSSSEGVPTTPSFSSSSEHHPAIMHSNGYVESARPALATGATYNYPGGSAQPPAWPLPAEPHNTQHHDIPNKDTEMSGLEVLVAVATREENATVTPNA